MEASGGSGHDLCHPSTSTTTFPDFLQKDTKGLWIFGESESKRRLVVIERQNGSFGFTLQSYGVRYKHGHRETDFITYVNAVEKNGAADVAGLREGDVILAINSQNMARVEHKALVNFIRQCPTTLKMVVVSDERARKVELHMRYVHLQKKLQDKLLELDNLTVREKEILAGTYNQSSVCDGSGTLGGPCLSAAACCFCPPGPKDKRNKEEIPSLVVVNPGPSTATISIIQPNSDLEEAKLRHVLQQRSKSVKLPSEKSGNSVGAGVNSTKHESAYLDSYRKCQSSRELHRKNSINGTTNPGPTQHNPCHRRPSDKSESVKPVSWDSLISSGTTKAFGGYGYGYGYGYFPTSSTKDTIHRTTVTHPHHHNHHSQCSQTQTYYKGPKHDDASKVKVVYNYVSPTYHTVLPKTGNTEDYFRRHTPGNTPTRSPHYSSRSSQSEKHHLSMCHRSKTLPSTKNAGSDLPVTPKSHKVPHPAKLEKTISDSSLSDHYKELSLAYFQRSGDNVRFSSEEDFDSYATTAQSHGHRKTLVTESTNANENQRRERSRSAGKERERIFV